MPRKLPNSGESQFITAVDEFEAEAIAYGAAIERDERYVILDRTDLDIRRQKLITLFRTKSL